jgi:hypothetical protein
MRASRIWSTALIVAAALLPATTFAQLTSSVVAGAEVSSAAIGERWRGWSSLGVSMRYDEPRWSLAGEASFGTDTEETGGAGSLGASLVSPVLGPLQLFAAGSFARSSLYSLPASELSANAGASLRLGRWGAWTGIASRNAPGADSLAEHPSPVFGGWRQLGAAVISLSFSPRRVHIEGSAASIRQVLQTDSMFNDTLGRWETQERQVTVGDSGRASRHQRWDQAEARLFWSSGRVAVDATLGGRVASADMKDELWAAVSGLYVLTRRVVIVGGAGSRPGEPRSGWQRRSFATLGVRLLGAPEPQARPPELRPVTSDFRVVPRNAGQYVLRVRVPHARTVELSADFTDWKPVSLSRVATDLWEATVAITPGTHQVNIRINGERWSAPPGVPAVEDEFNGTVGLLVVR